MIRFKRIVAMLLVFATALLCVGCGGPLSHEERKAQKALKKEYLQVGEKEMESALKEKYGKKLDVIDIAVPTYVNPISGESTGIYQPFVVGKVKYDKKEYDVCIDIDDGMICYDNIQYEQIVVDFKNWMAQYSKTAPYYLDIDVSVDIEGLHGMNSIYYSGNIEEFIKSGGCDLIIAFYEEDDVSLMSVDALAVLECAHNVILLETNGNRFGAKEAEDLYVRDMYYEHVPDIKGYWSNIDGEIECTTPRLLNIENHSYYNKGGEKHIALADFTAPEACAELLEQSDMEVVTTWFYVQDEDAALYFRKDQIPGYDKERTYYAIIGVNRPNGQYEAKLEPIKYTAGDFLFVKCEGVDNWYAICTDASNSHSIKNDTTEATEATE